MGGSPTHPPLNRAGRDASCGRRVPRGRSTPPDSRGSARNASGSCARPPARTAPARIRRPPMRRRVRPRRPSARSPRPIRPRRARPRGNVAQVV